mmetsp:Transcript_12965/g.19412  ORF Transcript_12965/g.19412 Transcript_12965/m.19412 type:complete len:928 (-) Transcript_12965:48-2831(-)
MKHVFNDNEADLAVVERLLNQHRGKRLDAGTVILLLWKCRRDPRLVAAAAAWLEQHSDVRTTFDGVEQFLSILAHMLVHLDVDWPSGTLERFTFIIAQQSPHLALQLHWILRASMEDYAPKANGKGGNELYYRRCAHLDEDIESIVAFSTARPLELERLFHRGEIDRDELINRGKMHGISIAQRLVEATLRPMLQAVDGRTALSDPNFVPHRKSTFSGAVRWCKELDVESHGRCTFSFSRPIKWIKAFAKIEGRSLLIYIGADADDSKLEETKQSFRKSYFSNYSRCCKSKTFRQLRRKLVRALPLDGASIKSYEDRKHRTWSFELRVIPRQSCFASIRLRFLTAQIRHVWLEHLVNESKRKPNRPPNTEESSVDLNLQRRHALFAEEREFADSLVDIAEQLRFLPREARQQQLASKLRTIRVPRLAYLPLCNSTDTWRTVLSVVTDEGSVFNTKERCPCLLYFETSYERSLEKLDVANVIHAYVSGTAENVSLAEQMQESMRLASSNGSTIAQHEKKKNSLGEEQYLETFNHSGINSNNTNLVEGSPRPTSIWRTEVVMSPLVRDQEMTNTAEKVPTMTPSKKVKNQIQSQATRLLKFWRDQINSASTFVEEHAPVSALRPHNNETQYQGRTATYGEGFSAIEEKIRQKSAAAQLDPSWSLRAVIVKSNDDLRQEVFVAQLITRYAKLFETSNLPIYLRPYRIIALSASTGMIELIADSISLDKLFANPDYPGSLLRHFLNVYGPESTNDFQRARSNFIASAAGAALISYFLLLKDRHNGNILLDKFGHLIEIDFGFCFGHATGGIFSLERAPFKLTRNMVELMGPAGFLDFQNAFADGLLAARTILDECATLIEIMQYKSNFPCFKKQSSASVARVATKFRHRHFPHLSELQIRAKAKLLCLSSLKSSGTYLYDLFQYKSNNIAF